VLFFALSPILVIHLEQRLTVLGGELRQHRAHPEHIAVHDVVAEDLGEDPPIHQMPIHHLVTCPHPYLHSPILHRIRLVPRTFDFVRVAVVPLVSLNPLAPLKEITQNLVETFNVGILTGRVWPLDPHQVPCEDVDAQLAAQGGPPRVFGVFVGTEGVPLRRDSLLEECRLQTCQTPRLHSQQALQVLTQLGRTTVPRHDHRLGLHRTSNPRLHA
jgi:hypothetical protein